MEPFAAFDTATALLRSRLAAVGHAQWALPSSCAGWSVRDLANHVIGTTERYALLMRGAAPGLLEPTHAYDYVADGALDALDHHAGALRALFARPGALARTAAHRAGAVGGEELLGMSLIEQTVHAWDVAVSTGGDTTLDESLCAHVLALWTGSVDRLRHAGFYADPTAPADDSAQARLLAHAGR